MTPSQCLSASLMAGALALAASGTAQAKSFQVLHAFRDGNDGATSNATVILDKKGNIFGTALQGGTSNNGVVFEITAHRKESILYSFAGGNDGRRPEAGLLEDKAGNLYGTTNQGGPSDLGTVFKLAPDGSETVLHTFTGGSDGSQPQANLIADKSGNLYGTALAGGSNGCDGGGCGTIFKLAPDGKFAVLYSFTGGNDGLYPVAGLLADKKGNFYGTASGGGANGDGTIFRLDKNGSLTVLYTFTGGTDGLDPEAQLIADSTGNLYGTTRNGGGRGNCGASGCGTIFKLAPSGRETVLHAFTGASDDGAEPYGGVVADKAGDLYGTAIDGGTQNLGVVFKLEPNGKLAVPHIFQGANDGAWPEATVTLDGRGNVFGTAYAEGPDGWGTVFKVTE